MTPYALHPWQNSAFWGQYLRVIPRFLPTLLIMGVMGGFVGAIHVSQRHRRA